MYIFKLFWFQLLLLIESLCVTRIQYRLEQQSENARRRLLPVNVSPGLVKRNEEVKGEEKQGQCEHFAAEHAGGDGDGTGVSEYNKRNERADQQRGQKETPKAKLAISPEKACNRARQYPNY